MQNTIYNKYFSNEFKTNYGSILSGFDLSQPYQNTAAEFYYESITFSNAQGRIDYDWEPGQGFILAAGIQEMFTRITYTRDLSYGMYMKLNEFDDAVQDMLLLDMGIDPSNPDRAFLKNNLYVNIPYQFIGNSQNDMFVTSGYALVEYGSPDKRFEAELGLRIDHYYLSGRDFSAESKPAISPRLNVDFNVFKNRGIFRSLDLSAGTGLFSSTDIFSYVMESQYDIDTIKPNRSWTSVAGANVDLPAGLSFNIEAYYKYIFDRMYMTAAVNPDGTSMKPFFDGEGRAWGIDLMLQKKQSRYWDGWISWSWNWSKYRNPNAGIYDVDIQSGDQVGNDWYFPFYHRFHNLNLILNFRPAPRFNIYTRFGIASGVPLIKYIGDKPLSYPVWVVNGSKFIEQYYWPSERDENNRTTPEFPLDIKFSFFGKSRQGKARYEAYIAVENVLGLLYTAQGNTTFNEYTGEINADRNSASIGIPFPIPSLGFKISY
jgi:hypothetical protein